MTVLLYYCTKQIIHCLMIFCAWLHR